MKIKNTARWLYRQLPGVVALLLVAAFFVVSNRPSTPEAERAELAGAYAFEPRAISLPGGFPQQEIREVNQDYEHIDAWISSVGAGIAMNDLDGDGLPNDLCVTDPRTDQVSITPTPDERADRYAPFALSTGDLPMTDAMAPMGCAPGDFDEDGRQDVLVYYWGRTPILFLADPAAPVMDGAALSATTFRATELVRAGGVDAYTGPAWNTNAVALADFDGDGHLDIYVGNYFPDGPVLDPTVSGGVSMNDSLSNATNGGADQFFRWTGATAADGLPGVGFEPVADVLPADISNGWVLGSSAADVDGDQLPELYLAQDHGKDAMLHNRSVPGQIRFEAVVGTSSPLVPKSKRIGADSFKGMAAEWADLDQDGLYDLFVSNITTPWGIQESNFQFMNTAGSPEELRADLQSGTAPWTDESTAAGTAWAGWAWDIKSADFTNAGSLALAQATGFVRGETNRWPQLQELATANDLAVHDPAWWPNVRAGDDIAGSQPLRFFAPTGDGGFVDLAPELGLAVPVPTRGIATGDSNGDGLVDMAVARQWDQPVFYQNRAPDAGNYLELTLVHDQETVPGALPAPGSPIVGAQVRIVRPDGSTLVSQVDGGSGHSGKRSTEVHLGLGDIDGPVVAQVTWRDRDGQVHQQDFELEPGRHTLRLGATADER